MLFQMEKSPSLSSRELHTYANFQTTTTTTTTTITTTNNDNNNNSNNDKLE